MICIICIIVVHLQILSTFSYVGEENELSSYNILNKTFMVFFGIGQYESNELQISKNCYRNLLTVKLMCSILLFIHIIYIFDILLCSMDHKNANRIIGNFNQWNHASVILLAGHTDNLLYTEE